MFGLLNALVSQLVEHMLMLLFKLTEMNIKLLKLMLKPIKIVFS